MKLVLNTKNYVKRILNIENQSVRTGILQETKKSNKSNRNEPLMKLQGSKYPRNPIRRGSKAKNIMLGDLARILDKKYGLISDAFNLTSNREVIDMVIMFSKPDKTKRDIKRLENACRAVLRNPILKKKYGKNKRAYAKMKRFNMPGVDTGTFFRNIEAKYSNGKRKN